VRIANFEHYSQFRNFVIADNMKNKRRKKILENLLEKYSFYLKTHNQFTAVLIQFLTVENIISDC
jgi:hypothetical protein